MTDNCTNSEMFKLAVKDVHFSAGKSDYMGWPTITIQNADGKSQWYVPSGNLRYMEEIEAVCIRRIEEAKELKQDLDRLRTTFCELLEIEAKLRRELAKETDRQKKDAINYNQLIRVFMQIQREMIEKDIRRDKLWRLKMQDEIQIAVNRCKRDAKGGKK